MIIEGRQSVVPGLPWCVVVKFNLCCRAFPVWDQIVRRDSVMTWRHRKPLQRSPDYPLVLHHKATVRLWEYEFSSLTDWLLYLPQTEDWGGLSCIFPPLLLTTPARTRILTEVRLFTDIDIDIDIEIIIRFSGATQHSARDRGGLWEFREWFLFSWTSFTKSVHRGSHTGVYR